MNTASMMWRNQRLEFLGVTVDKASFDTERPCLKVNDARTWAAVYGKREGSGNGYLVNVRLPDMTYDVLAKTEAEAMDAFMHFLPMLEIDVAKHVWAMLRARRHCRPIRPGHPRAHPKNVAATP